MSSQITFGDTIKKLREERSLTLREVAEAISIDISMLSKIEKNTRKPTDTIIDKLSKFFNVTKKELTIAFLSDTVAYRIVGDDENAEEILKAAEEKVEYLRRKKNTNL